ncbi:MAG: alpha/beta hydrolase [Anaerolineae bacterium]
MSFEDQFIYYPSRFPEGFWQPELFGLSVQDIYFSAEDGVKLHGWFAPSPGAPVTLLFCHGNAGNITHRLENVKGLVDLGLNVFIFDYRGYGRSEGTPSEEGLYLDAVTAYDYLLSHDRVNQGKLYLFGRSLGGAVAVELALRRPVAGLIIESAFTSVPDMARAVLPYFPVHLFVQTRFDSLSKISKVKVPILIIHGTADTVVPFRHGQRLFQAANEPKQFYQIAEANHNDTYIVGGRAYFERMAKFLEQIAGDGF